MTTVNLKINGRDYQIACDDGQEEDLRLLADEIDDRIHSLIFRMRTPPAEGMSLVLASLTMADEIKDLKKENQRLAMMVDNPVQPDNEERMVEMEAAMAVTLEEIASRIEKIADQLEFS